MNGYKSDKKYIDMIDVTSADYMRPAGIKQEVRQMSERKRVNEILRSRQFREDLEKVVVDRINISPQDKASLKVLQQMSELPPSQARLKHGPIFAQLAEGSRVICDLQTEANKTLACKLACCSRLLNQAPSLISARTSDGTFLVTPSNLPPSFTTASSLLSLDAQGRVMSGGKVGGGAGGDGVVEGHSLVAAMFEARESVSSVVLLRGADALEVSSGSDGLLALSRQAMVVGSVAVVDLKDESSSTLHLLQTHFHSASKVALLKGCGFMVVGDSISEAFITARRLTQALSIQVKASEVGLENMQLLSEGAQKRILKVAASSGEVEFEGLLRKLEHEGVQTGLSVRGLGRVERVRISNDVELPPTVVAVGYAPEDRPTCTKQASFTEYLNSPMSYKKEETDLAPEAPYNKTVTKWVAEASASGTTIKIDNANQFVPLDTDPAVLKKAVKMIRKEYYDEKITSGPSSKILEAPSWQEAQEIRDSNTTSDTVVRVGAASRGVIQKGHQNQGTLYRTYYAPNPFDNMTPEQLESYQQEVMQQRPSSKSHYLGEEDSSEPGADGELVSTEERLQQFKQLQETAEAADAAGATGFQQQLQQQQQFKQHLQQAPSQQQQAAQQFEAPQLFQQQPPQQHLQQPAPVHQDVKSPASPCKSASSGDAANNEVFSGNESGATDAEKKKKKRGFKMPSFSKKKDKK